MTDGILLAEMQPDRMLRQYDTLIIDEAHERSLNIDFILGYLKQLLPRRPDLKVIITSATIEPERFAKHFADAEATRRPIVEVSGRTYPVEVRYRPLVEVTEGEEEDEADEENVRDQIQAIGDAVDELAAEGPGDILVFLSGEREIRDTADALGKLVQSKRSLPGTEILPLYARLSAAEQHRVFAAHSNRRVVLATNVAETSLTVPGIKYVVDPGTARISRYSHRLKVQRLPIEPVSQASPTSARAAAGGPPTASASGSTTRTDFVSRPEFTDPEILRTNLASVILQMTSIGLGDIAAFPFVEPPDRRNVTDGVNLLHELGALDPAEADPAKRLTPLGRQLAQLPVDPRLARMVLEGDRNGCVTRGHGHRRRAVHPGPARAAGRQAGQADQAHARFADKESDFVAFLNLWSYLQEKQRELSSSAFRRLCKAEFLNYLRVREWQDIFSQLRQVSDPGVTLDGTSGDEPSPRRPAPACRARRRSDTAEGAPVAAARPAVAPSSRKDAHEARVPRRARRRSSRSSPGSALFKKPPRWVMAAELVETSRLWARVAGADRAGVGRAARRAPGQAQLQRAALGEEAGRGDGLREGHPVRRPDRRRAQGQLRPDRPGAEPGAVHPARPGRGRLADPPRRSSRDNRKLLDEVEELEERARRRDILVDDETLFDFYDQRIPADVVSGRHFDAWWKKTRARAARPAHLRPVDAAQSTPAGAASAEARLPGRVAARAALRCR